MRTPPGPWRAVWLLTALRLRRQCNQLASTFARRNKPGGKARAAAAGKRHGMWLLSPVVAGFMLYALINMASMTVLNMECRLVPDSACARQLARDDSVMAFMRSGALSHEQPFADALMAGLGLVLAALFAIAVLLPLAGKELAQPDSDLEWLVTLPVARSTLLWGRLIERSAGNLSGMFALFPAYVVLAWYSGLRWTAVPAALLATAWLLPLAALLHTLADTGLRQWLSAAQLRNLQALVSMVSVPLMYVVIALGMPAASGFVMELARAAPDWTLWLPPGLLLQALQAQNIVQLGSALALLLLQTTVLLWAGMALLRHQLRHGVAGASVRASGRSRQNKAGTKTRARVGATVEATEAAAAAASTAPLTASKAAAASGRPRWQPRSPLSPLSPLSPVMRRELRLLSRDRNFLVQTLVLPLIIVASQLTFNDKLDTLDQLGAMPAMAAAIAFGIGVYVLMLSAFQTLNNEGHALWLLYTLPLPVEQVLRDKARLWSVLALVYPLGIAALTFHYAEQPDWSMLGLLVIVLAGIPIYATIAVALGVFACDPAATEVHRRIRPTYSYLFMLLSAFYTWSLYTDVWWQKLVIMVLSAALALALWQKARDALPYLLDPAAAPPARVSAADGLIAATGFFIVQAILALVLIGTGDQAGAAAQSRVTGAGPSVQVLTAAFAGAGLLVYALMRLIYWRAGTVGVPRLLPGGDERWWPSVRLALLPCALACAVALAYLAALRYAQVALPPDPFGAGARAWIVALAVLAAPLCEEFIFRGLLYGGLRRSLPAWQAIVVSAAVFAVIHPPLSMVPVFALGLCTAWTYERSKTLLAPMLVHGAYNGLMVLAQ